MNVRVTSRDDTTHVSLEGRFVFDDRRTFTSAIDAALAERTRNLIVDLSTLDYLDSAALGMLLILRDKAQAAKKPLALKRAPGPVDDILAVARFDRLFDLR
jgi:anti-anti-sigma factor